jgi:hypothetical protein
MRFISEINQRLDSVMIECWNWFTGLHQEEWFVLLGAVAVFGFLCMRGFSSQGRI